MSVPRTLRIVTLPGRNADECRAEIELARRAGADLAEIRFDRWPDGAPAGPSEIFPSPIPLIATYRSRREGGEGSDDPIVRAGVLRRLAAWPFWAIDRERDLDGPAADPDGAPAIRSSHLPERSPTSTVLARLFEGHGEVRFTKVVLPARVSVALDLLDDLGLGPDSGGFVLHTSGPSGNLLRALATSLGFPAVYASLPEREGRAPVEPAQVPVDRLARYASTRPPGPLFALLGASTERSPSPSIFAGWMSALDDPGLYLRLDILTASELDQAIERLPARGFRGFNVTNPWKRVAWELADEVAPGAQACGSANVLSISPGGTVAAENTDLAATLRRLGELRNSGTWSGRELLVLGTGGAARAALAAGRASGAELRLAGRRSDVARQLASEFGATSAADVPAGPVELVVNATSIGHRESGPPGVDPTPWLGPGTRLLDFVYTPDEPWFRRSVEGRGGSYEDGRRLLAYQAAESYALWFGHEVPNPLVDEAAGGAA